MDIFLLGVFYHGFVPDCPLVLPLLFSKSIQQMLIPLFCSMAELAVIVYGSLICRSSYPKVFNDYSFLQCSISIEISEENSIFSNLSQFVLLFNANFNSIIISLGNHSA